MTGEDEHDQPQADLDAAVEAYFKHKGWGGFLSGWVLVAHQHRLNEETGKVDDSAHPIAYMGGEMTDHTALGLLQIASDVVRGVGRWARDEEEEE